MDKILTKWVFRLAVHATAAFCVGVVVYFLACHIKPDLFIRPGQRSLSPYGSHATAVCPAEALAGLDCLEQRNPVSCRMLAGDPVEAVSVSGDKVIVRVLAERRPGQLCGLCPSGCLYSMNLPVFRYGPDWYEDDLKDQAAERRAQERAKELLRQRP